MDPDRRWKVTTQRRRQVFVKSLPRGAVVKYLARKVVRGSEVVVCGQSDVDLENVQFVLGLQDGSV